MTAQETTSLLPVHTRPDKQDADAVPQAESLGFTSWMPLLASFVAIAACLLWLIISGRIHDVANWLRDHKTTGCVIIFAAALPIGTPFAIGYSALLLAAGFTYGFPFALIPVVLGTNFSCLLNFLLLRYVVRDWMMISLESASSSSVRKWTLVGFRSLERKPMLTVFLIRLTPLVFGIQNALFATSLVDLQTYMIATFCGMLPGHLAYTFAGSILHDFTSSAFSDGDHLVLKLLLLGWEVVCIVAALVIITCNAQKILEEMADSDPGIIGTPTSDASTSMA